MPDYQKGKIYKIVNDKLGLTYYGSTTQILSQRMGGHIANKKKFDKGKCTNVSSFQLLDGNQKIYLVEKYPCNDKIELLKRERYYIENNECVNKCIPTRTMKEYYIDNKYKIKEYFIDNKDKFKIYKKKYYEDNKEKIKQYQKQYLEDNKDKLKQYRDKKKDKIKQYKEDNKEKIKQYQKQYRDKNKQIQKQYYDKNKDIIKQKDKQYRDKNKDKIKQKNKQYRDKNKLKYLLSPQCIDDIFNTLP